MRGYGSLIVAKFVIWQVNVNLFVDTTVRLKGNGTPCLQSCFKGPFTGNVKVEINSVCERTLNHQL